MRTLIANLGLEKSVILAGYTTDPAAVYKRASACLLTSRYEGFGLVVLEAMARDARLSPSTSTTALAT